MPRAKQVTEESVETPQTPKEYKVVVNDVVIMTYDNKENAQRLADKKGGIVI